MRASIPDYLQFWGKAQAVQPEGRGAALWHPLAWHSLDVAAVADVLLEREASLVVDFAARSGADPLACRRFLVCLAALHDIGKFSLGFQAKAPDYFPAVLIRPRTDKTGDHPAIGGWLLGASECDDLWRRLAPTLDQEVRGLLAGAIAGHHGRPVSNAAQWPVDEIGRVAIAAAVQFAHDLVELLAGGAFFSQLDEKAATLFSWRLAGFVTLADWIGSNQRIFRYEAPDRTLADYWQHCARPRAQQAVEAAGLGPSPVSPLTGFAALTGRGDDPSPLQAYCETIGDLDAGPGFFLIEDMTGAGKTEAALILAHRLMRAGRAHGLFVALPTQATANAMYGRLGGLYRRLFAASAKPSLALSHGGAKLHDGFQDSILEVGQIEDGYDRRDEGDVTASAACAAWIGSDRRRSVFADIGVSTIDQLFLSVLPVKFAALRLAGLAGKVLILDEIHAYGAYEAAELQCLIQFHAAQGGSIIALSATLPELVKDLLIKAWNSGRRIRGKPVQWSPDYPLVTQIDGTGGVQQRAIAARADLPRRVAVERLAHDQAALEAIAAAVAQGAAVAWIRNTIDDVLAAQAALAERGITATVFHARFAMQDRQIIEAEVIAALGPASTPQGRHGRVVVASQVIEQSIDVDFDLMISDLAPIDLLIQRAGRLWRHPQRSRPLPGPRLLVLSPDPAGPVGADWLSGPLPGTSYVYRNHALMWQTAKVLFATGNITAPSDLRRLVEAVYSRQALEAAPETLERSRLRAEGQDSADRAYARMNLLKVTDGYTDQGNWQPEIHTPTRAGEQRTICRLARFDGTSLIPWAGAIVPGMSPREMERLWSLSEVAVSRRRAEGRGDYPAAIEEAARGLERGWGEMAAGIVVLPLLVEVGQYRGWVRTGGQSRAVSYDRQSGLMF